MATTPTYGFPTPDTPEEANGPTQLQALAQAIENLLTSGVLQMTNGTIHAADPTGATNPVTRGWYEARIIIGPADSPPAAGSVPDGAVFLGI